MRSRGKAQVPDKDARHQIWRTVKMIPIGCVASYGQVADLAGLPGRARWVGRVLGQSPASMTIPWHRVLRSDGRLAFSPGSAESAKQTGLLQEEGVVVFNNKVRMADFQWRPSPAELLFSLDF